MAAYSRTKLAQHIASLMANGVSNDQIANEIAAFLIDMNKTADLDSIMRDVQDLRAEQHGVVELTVRSAFPLDASEKNQIEAVAKRQYPNAQKVVMHEVRDASVVGGASLSLAGQDLDLTIRTKLNRLREAVS